MHVDALLIVNKQAREGRTDLQEGIDRLYQAGWAIREESPDHPEKIPQMIREQGPHADRIIVGGGDGTLNGAAEALVESSKPVGVLPLGTANDLARTLCIPEDLAAAIQVILDGERCEIDLGSVNDKYFFNVANMGLGAKVTQKLSGEKKKLFGVFAYLQSLVEAFRANRHFHVHLVCDGEEESFSSIQVSVGNGRHYGGGMTVAVDAKIDDDILNFYSLKPQSFLKLTTQALALRTGKIHDKERVIYRCGKTMEISTDRVMDVSTDGELTTRTPARFKVIHQALSVYVPKEYLARPADEA